MESFMFTIPLGVLIGMTVEFMLSYIISYKTYEKDKKDLDKEKAEDITYERLQ